VEGFSLMKNSLSTRSGPGLDTKHADFGAF
jgi:hypothetical protein